MLDSRRLRLNLPEVAAALSRRGYQLDVERYTELEERRRALQIETQELQNERNAGSREIGQAKARGEDIAPMRARISEIGARLDEVKTALEAVQLELEALFLDIPNIPHESVPDGREEKEHLELRGGGQAAASGFKPREQ